MHEPVLLQPLIAAVFTDPAGTYVDATFGRGGHSRALLALLEPEARLLVIDRDPEAVRVAAELAARDARVIVRHGRFGELGAIAADAQVASAAGVMVDLGVSSPQLDDAARGFSFRSSSPLDMRMDPTTGRSAADIVNEESEAELERIFREYGEERYARRIARAIVERRAVVSIATTDELAEIVAGAQPRPDPHKHAATRVFQALRIAVNDELTELARGLDAAFELLAAGGRLAVISFHSLEDRIVKRAFAQWVSGPAAPRRLPMRGGPVSRAFHLSKPVRADAAEVARNPRSRSATLRALEKRA
jgi:16S rRNA (cytosine1402-N4)-methyltransferase